MSNDLIIKSFDTGFQLSVWLSKGLIIKPKSSTIKSFFWLFAVFGRPQRLGGKWNLFGLRTTILHITHDTWTPSMFDPHQFAEWGIHPGLIGVLRVSVSWRVPDTWIWWWWWWWWWIVPHQRSISPWFQCVHCLERWRRNVVDIYDRPQTIYSAGQGQTRRSRCQQSRSTDTLPWIPRFSYPRSGREVSSFFFWSADSFDSVNVVILNVSTSTLLFIMNRESES
jgi:hypothetical protein